MHADHAAPFPRATRNVRTLRVKAPDPGAAWRVQTALEDALRTANLGDDARCWLVRRLDLGRLPDRILPRQLARLLEARVAALQYLAVPGADPAAAQAECVVFADASVALGHVAQALARGQPPAWFWPQAAPGFRADVSVRDNLAALLQRTLASADGAPRAAAVLRAVVNAGAGELLCAALSPELGAALLRQAGVGAALQRQGGLAHVSTGSAVASPAVLCWIAQWGDDDARSRWLAACLPLTLARAQRFVQPDAVQPDAVQPDAFARDSLRPDATPPGSAQPGFARRISTDPGQLAARASDTAMQRIPQAHVTPVLSDLPQSAFAPLAARCPHAGLMLLVPALTRLGIADWLMRYPQPLLPALLADLAARVGSPLDAALAEAFPPDGDAVCAPAALAAWRCLLRRYCRVYAHIGLHDLVVRPGRIVVTPLHLDVFFEPGAVDLRIRRAGLDLDPGWVPWLGRVLRFHYVDGAGGGHA